MYLAVRFFAVLPLYMCGNCAERDAITGDQKKHLTKTSANNTDMYVVHAIVYEVGILTNKTHQPQNKNFTGKQEAITFYNSEGSKLDLTKLGNPLVTNVSAQDLVGISDGVDKKIDINASRPGWISLNEINSLELAPMGVNNSDPDTSNVKRRSIPSLIMNGTTKIPEEVGIKSIVIPPLLVLNNKYSKIPVPIPNTSLVSYAKINMSIVRTP